jgi:hypothetical protein
LCGKNHIIYNKQAEDYTRQNAIREYQISNQPALAYNMFFG